MERSSQGAIFADVAAGARRPAGAGPSRAAAGTRRTTGEGARPASPDFAGRFRRPRNRSVQSPSSSSSSSSPSFGERPEPWSPPAPPRGSGAAGRVASRRGSESPVCAPGRSSCRPPPCRAESSVEGARSAESSSEPSSESPVACWAGAGGTSESESAAESPGAGVGCTDAGGTTVPAPSESRPNHPVSAPAPKATTIRATAPATSAMVRRVPPGAPALRGSRAPGAPGAAGALGAAGPTGTPWAPGRRPRRVRHRAEVRRPRKVLAASGESWRSAARPPDRRRGAGRRPRGGPASPRRPRTRRSWPRRRRRRRAGRLR